jgi:hypothetical protein
LIPLPNPWAKGLKFGVYVVLGLVVFLVDIFRFLLIQRVLVDHNLAMECPWGVPTIPNVLCKSVEWIRRSGVGFRGVDPWALFILNHRFDRCSWPVLPVWALCGICLKWIAWFVCLSVVLLLVSSW